MFSKMNYDYVMTTVNCSYREKITPEELCYYLTHKDVSGFPYVVVFFSEVLPHIQTKFIEENKLDIKRVKIIARWYQQFGYDFKVYSGKEKKMYQEIINAILFMIYPIIIVLIAWWMVKTDKF